MDISRQHHSLVEPWFSDADSPSRNQKIAQKTMRGDKEFKLKFGSLKKKKKKKDKNIKENGIKLLKKKLEYIENITDQVEEQK